MTPWKGVAIGIVAAVLSKSVVAHCPLVARLPGGRVWQSTQQFGPVHGCMMIDLATYTVGATAESGQWWHEFLGLHAVWYDLLVGPLWILAGALLRALVASVSMVRLSARAGQDEL